MSYFLELASIQSVRSYSYRYNHFKSQQIYPLCQKRTESPSRDRRVRRSNLPEDEVEELT